MWNEDTMFIVAKKYERTLVVQSDASDFSKVAIQAEAMWVYLSRRETIRLIAYLLRLLVANLGEKSRNYD